MNAKCYADVEGYGREVDVGSLWVEAMFQQTPQDDEHARPQLPIADSVAHNARADLALVWQSLICSKPGLLSRLLCCTEQFLVLLLSRNEGFLEQVGI